MGRLEAELADRMQRRYARLVGRGTTALFVALRAMAVLNGPAEVILPDVICSVVLDAVLLAGFIPNFSNITPQRFGLDFDDVRRRIGPQTAAVIIPHLFGYVMNPPDLGVPILEDAVQGLGGRANAGQVGTLGKISFTSFHESKMISGRGGLVATDDLALWEAIGSVRLHVTPTLPDEFDGAGDRFRQYRNQIAATRSQLITEFDQRSVNVSAIRQGWATLSARTEARNEKAAYLRDRLSQLPVSLHLPEIAPGDAIWRYTFAAPDRATTHWILRHLQGSGLTGSHLYPSLGELFEPGRTGHGKEIAPQLINLWVDDATTTSQLDRAVEVIRTTPDFSRARLRQIEPK
jgi:dTDP-4-amino-4,6-dideoxygalactose transaminase